MMTTSHDLWQVGTDTQLNAIDVAGFINNCRCCLLNPRIHFIKN